MLDIDLLVEEVKKSKHMVFFGGAGVSTESGIPDFRGSGGLYTERLYEGYEPEVVLSNKFYHAHPDIFFDFVRDKVIYENVKPNEGHKALARLEEMGILKAIITQNIDNLHQDAGSKRVIELHGNINRSYCTHCHKDFDAMYIKHSKGACNCDECGALIKPDVVLYGEALDNNVMDEAINEISKADLLLVAGTSLKVYPAAGLIRYFNSDNLVIINKDKTSYDRYAKLVFNEGFGKILKEVVDRIDI